MRWNQRDVFLCRVLFVGREQLEELSKSVINSYDQGNWFNGCWLELIGIEELIQLLRIVPCLHDRLPSLRDISGVIFLLVLVWRRRGCGWCFDNSFSLTEQDHWWWWRGLSKTASYSLSCGKILESSGVSAGVSWDCLTESQAGVGREVFHLLAGCDRLCPPVWRSLLIHNGCHKVWVQ